jgi:hypothetical protein
MISPMRPALWPQAAWPLSTSPSSRARDRVVTEAEAALSRLCARYQENS